MKFSSLPATIQALVLREHRAAKVAESADRMRYFAQNGYKSAEAYRVAVIAERPQASELKSIILATMKAQYMESGFQEWMNLIPNADMICHRYSELVMGTKAELNRRCN